MKKIRKGGVQMMFSSKKGFGINEIIGIAAGLIIAVLIVFPSLQGLAENVMLKLSDWWESVASSLFS
ncbi:hypothetical protein EOM86_03630 [Candidatus Nomurabacteria bacterium]|nr:hypothetical protein [Candidatus Nomurabacteria bacterium]